jgi:hypothetical protein
MHGGAVIDDPAPQHDFIPNVAYASSKVSFALQNKLHRLVLPAADEAADLLYATTAHIEIIDSNKHVPWLQLARGLCGLIWN